MNEKLRLSDEQFEILKNSEKILSMAYRDNYVYGATYEELQKMRKIYMDLGYKSVNPSCNSCAIGMLHSLGAIYFSDKAIRETEEPEKVEQIKEKEDGRKTKKQYTKSCQVETKKAEFLENVRKSRGIIKNAAEAIQVNRQTIYYWFEKDPEFYQNYLDILEEQVDFVEGKLLKKIEEEDTSSIHFYLKTKGKNRGYGESKDINVKGDGDFSINLGGEE